MGVAMKAAEKQKTGFGRVLLFGSCAGLMLIAAGVWFVSWMSAKSGPTVSGVVRLDGDTLEKGAIRFVPVEGTAGSDGGAVIREGKYNIAKVLKVGKYRVEI